jgi:hypothetical protein
MMVFAGVMTICFSLSHVGPAQAAEKDQPPKKPKASSQAKPAKPKGETATAGKPSFQTAEKAEKAKACFGAAPKIEKLTPDEGKPGEKVTIKGSQFGSADCLRGVSFGPGHAASFTMQNDTTITATVPSGGRKGLAMVTVTTASGEDSKAFLVK